MNPLAGIVAWGARTSLGLNALQTGLVYRAGGAGLREAALLDKLERPISLCRLDVLDPFLTGVDRAWALARPALDECILPHQAILRELRLEVLTCLDSGYERKGGAGAGPASQTPAAQLGAEIQRHVRRAVHSEVVTQTTTLGAAAPGFVLGDVLSRLNSGQSDAVLLGGVHTDYDLVRIRALEAQGRLFSTENLDSLLPGEGAAYILLFHPHRARQFALRTFAGIIAYGTGQEKARADNDESAFSASGLTLATHRATEVLRHAGASVGWWINDVAFETYRVHEWQAVATRMADVLSEPQRVDCPAQRLGNLGGASLPLACVLAAEAWKRGYGFHPRALCTAGSEGGERAALLLASGA